jgi:imidazolonepropionase-like amidohydrolase
MLPLTRFPAESPQRERFACPRPVWRSPAAWIFGGAALLALLLPGCAGTRNPTPDGPVTAIVGATVVHPERKAAEAREFDRTILIERDRILAIGPSQSTAIPPNARIIDGKGRWVIPGLIDSHVHFFQSGNLYTRPDVADFNGWMPYAREVARNTARLETTFKIWLASGVTGVVDIGGPFWNFEVRALAARSAAAPEVAVAGPLISSVSRPSLDLGDPPIIQVNTPQEARALVARELAYKPDYIKVWFIFREGDDLPRQEAIVRATAEAAHRAGVRLAVHATELATAKAALRAGADFLVHSVEDLPVDEEFLALARKNRVLYCPTLFVYQGYGFALSNTWRPTAEESRLADPQILGMMSDLDRIPAELVPERVKARLQKSPPIQTPLVAMQNLRRVMDEGITVVLGTDAGNIGTLHGPSVFREARLMQAAGLSPLEVLRSATFDGARALGREQDMGIIAPGKLADLVILGADPLADSANLAAVRQIVRRGSVFDPDELIRSAK